MGFAGMDRDEETATSYSWHRTLQEKQWLNEDPSGFLGGGDTNLKRYVNNDPSARVDPTGLVGGGIFPNDYVERMYLSKDSDEYKRGQALALRDSYIGVMVASGLMLGGSYVGGSGLQLVPQPRVLQRL